MVEKMGWKVRKCGRFSCRQRFRLRRLFCRLRVCLLLTVCAGGLAGFRGDMPAMPVQTVYAEDTSAEGAGADTEQPAGETQVSAWVEAAGEPDDNEPEENPGGPGEERPDGEGTKRNDPAERNRVKTGDTNAIVFPVLMLLAGGIVIRSCRKIF